MHFKYLCVYSVGSIINRNSVKRLIKQTKPLPPVRKEPIIIRGKSAVFRSLPSANVGDNNTESKANNKKSNGTARSLPKVIKFNNIYQIVLFVSLTLESCSKAFYIN